MGKQWKQWQTLFFFGSKITVDDDCSHEIQRLLLLEREAMNNLDSILKSKDVTLRTEVCLVKATTFPIVLYGYKNWTIEKLSAKELKLLNYGVGEDPWIPCTARSNQSILKEISPEYSLDGLMLKLKLQYFGQLMQRTDLLQKTLMLRKIKGVRRGGRLRMKWLDGIPDSMNITFEQVPGVGDRQGSQACCSPWGHKESDTTEWLNWTDI